MKHLWFVCGNNSGESTAVIKYLVHRKQLLVLILGEALNPENECWGMIKDQVITQYMIKHSGESAPDLSDDIRQLIIKHGYPHRTIIFNRNSLIARQLSLYFANRQPENVICFENIMKK
jgi:hypothetical protein